MALCSFAVKKLIAPGSNDPKITPRMGIWHVDAGNAESLFDYFSTRSGGVESHFFIKLNGVLEQYRDTSWQADANYQANDFAVSVETQGFGDGVWTPEQIDTSKRLMRWLNATHGIPYRKVQVWNGQGFGYHTQFGAPGPWTPVAKSCPGPGRIVQFNKVLVPWLDEGAPMVKVIPTLNITAALQADSSDERRAALQRIARFGADEASAAAKQWLSALIAVDQARAAAKEARQDLKNLEIKV